MLRRIEATTITRVGFERTTALVGQSGWPWLGQPGRQACTRLIRVPRLSWEPFRLRMTEFRHGPDAVASTIQLEVADTLVVTSLIRGRLTMGPAHLSSDPGVTYLRFRGDVTTALAHRAKTISRSDARHLAHEYVHSLLDQIGSAMVQASATEDAAVATGSNGKYTFSGDPLMWSDHSPNRQPQSGQVARQ